MSLLPHNELAAGYKAFVSLGNGNCLYNSVSLLLEGNFYLALLSYFFKWQCYIN